MIADRTGSAQAPDAPIPAGSLILMYERLGAPPEYLFVRRAPALAFAADAYVFPGGRVDAADRVPDDAPDEDRAARNAALRETREETGIVVDVSAADLVAFARWLPMHERLTRRFDARFYLARAVRRTPPVPDGIESSAALWATATDILARCAAGDGRALFPTRRLLERLARFDTFDAASADARRWPDRIVSPWIEHREGGDWLRIPADAGYPVTEEPLVAATRC